MGQGSHGDSGEGIGLEPVDILGGNEQGWGKPTQLLGPVHRATGSLAVTPVVELGGEPIYKDANSEIVDEEAERMALWSKS